MGLSWSSCSLPLAVPGSWSSTRRWGCGLWDGCVSVETRPYCCAREGTTSVSERLFTAGPVLVSVCCLWCSPPRMSVPVPGLLHSHNLSVFAHGTAGFSQLLRFHWKALHYLHPWLKGGVFDPIVLLLLSQNWLHPNLTCLTLASSLVYC